MKERSCSSFWNYLEDYAPMNVNLFRKQQDDCKEIDVLDNHLGIIAWNLDQQERENDREGMKEMFLTIFQTILFDLPLNILIVVNRLST